MGRKIKGRVSALPIRLLLHRALRLLSSRALSSGRIGRIYHDPLSPKRRNFLTQNGPKKGASSIDPHSNLKLGTTTGGRLMDIGTTHDYHLLSFDVQHVSTIKNQTRAESFSKA
jgi:hypothetical protein